MSKDDFYGATDIDILRAENSRLKQQLEDVQSTVQELRRELHREKQELSDKESRLISEEQQLSELDRQLKQRSEDVERMVLWFEELHTEISSVLNSRPWRALYIVGQLKRRLLRRPRVPTARDRVGEVVKKFHSWRIGYTRSEILSGGQERIGSRRLRAFARSRETALSQPSKSNEKLARAVRKRIGPVPERTDWPPVSIVILNRNGLNHLKRLFSGLQNRTDYPDFELVLVDNGSTDGSVEFAKSFGAEFPVRLVENSGNTSFSTGNNQGAETATNELLLFLNNDIEPFEAGWLKELVNPIESSRAGAVGALLLYPGKAGYQPASGYAVQHRGIKFVRRNLGEPRAFNLGNGEDALGGHLGADRECPAVTAACLLVGREAFGSVGGFTERYKYGQEDVDFGLKITASGREVVSSGRAVLIHHEYGTQSVEGRDFALINMRGNQRILMERWGPQLHRELLLDRLNSTAFWSNKPVQIAITVTSEDVADGYNDWYVAHELGEALERRGCNVIYAERQRWYSLQADIDYLLVLQDSYDVSRVPFVTTIAWIANQTERWVRRPWFEKFDVVLAPSVTSARMVEQSTSKTAHIFPMATNPERFSRTPLNPIYQADYVFTGDYYPGETSNLADHLHVAPEETFIIFGKGWEKVPRLIRYARGHLPHDQLPQIYSSAKLLVDDANDSTPPCGVINSRVFDALATGTLVVTNCEAGVREFFDEDFPTYSTRQELRGNLDQLLGDEARRDELTGRYQEIVLREHTYDRRAEQLHELLRGQAESLSFCIKVDAPDWDTVRTWGDLRYARAMRRQLQRRGYPCIIQVLDEWDNFKGLKYDVVIHLNGTVPYVPKPSQFNVLWNIGHSEPPTPRECDQYDLVFVTSERLAAELRPKTNTPVAVLEQASDSEVFFPDPDPVHQCELVFVGDSRKTWPKILRDLLPTDRDLVVWGAGWEGLIDEKHLVGCCLTNDQTRKAYSSASIVLVDHQDDMRERGLIPTQVYNALACGALVISDDLPELSERFGDVVVTYDSPEKLHSLINHYLDSPQERGEKGQRGRKLVLADHTFEHRVEKLLQRIKEVTEEGGFRTRIRTLARAT